MLPSPLDLVLSLVSRRLPPALLAASLLPGCGDSVATGTPTQVSGALVDEAGRPLAGALVAVEIGGIFQKRADFARGSPYYKLGALTASNGAFTLAVPDGSLGFHGYAAGHACAARVFDTTLDGATVNLQAPSLGAGDPRPSITAASIVPAVASPGQALSLRAAASSGNAADPLSDQILVVLPDQSLAAELDPPPGATDARSPDGAYTIALRAPATAGMYTFRLVAVTEACRCSDIASVTLTVQ